MTTQRVKQLCAEESKKGLKESRGEILIRRGSNSPKQIEDYYSNIL